MSLLCVHMNSSDSFVLDGFLGVDDSLFVEDSVPADSALDGVIGLEFGLLSAISLAANVCHIDQLAVVDLHRFIFYFK